MPGIHVEGYRLSGLTQPPCDPVHRQQHPCLSSSEAKKITERNNIRQKIIAVPSNCHYTTGEVKGEAFIKVKNKKISSLIRYITIKDITILSTLQSSGLVHVM